MAKADRIHEVELSMEAVKLSKFSADDRKLEGSKGRVLVIYTGGTIGSAPRDQDDKESPEIVYPWKKLKPQVPKLRELKFPVDAVSFDPPLDSSNVGPRHWKKMAEVISEHYESYTGFVIAHGTDTMVYTASALSFILQDLEKPVIVTGSQISALRKVRNDAEQNLITALLIANWPNSRITCIPEVCIFFRDSLIRGNRCRKIDASGYTAFQSPNYPLLGIVGHEIEIREGAVLKRGTANFQLQSEFSTDVILVDIFPGFQDNFELIERLIGNKSIRGIVLKTYGTGNIPTEPPDLLRALREAVQKRGVLVLNVTQCIHGDVQQGLYDTSAVLEDIGVISGQDMTPEAALCKLMNVIGNPDFEGNLPQMREELCQARAGEQCCSMYTTIIDSDPQSVKAADGEKGRYRSRAVHINGEFRRNVLTRALIRFVDATIEGTEKLSLKIFLNLPAGGDPSRHEANLAGYYKKSRDPKGQEQTFTFDLVHTLRQVLSTANLTVTVYVFPDKGVGDDGVLTWQQLGVTLFADEQHGL